MRPLSAAVQDFENIRTRPADPLQSGSRLTKTKYHILHVPNTSIRNARESLQKLPTGLARQHTSCGRISQRVYPSDATI